MLHLFLVTLQEIPEELFIAERSDSKPSRANQTEPTQGLPWKNKLADI
jgi:hypothetical protein